MSQRHKSVSTERGEIRSRLQIPHKEYYYEHLSSITKDSKIFSNRDEYLAYQTTKCSFYSSEDFKDSITHSGTVMSEKPKLFVVIVEFYQSIDSWRSDLFGFD